MKYQVVIQDREGSRWLGFQDPVETYTVRNISQVLPCLNEIERKVNSESLFAAGYIGYESSPAFDSALRVREPGPAPLMWIGLYSRPEEISLPTAP